MGSPPTPGSSWSPHQASYKISPEQQALWLKVVSSPEASRGPSMGLPPSLDSGEGLCVEALAEPGPLGEGLRGVCSVPCERLVLSPSTVCPWVPSPCPPPHGPREEGVPSTAAAQPPAVKLGRVPACKS